MYAKALPIAARWQIDRQALIHLGLIAALLVSLLAPLMPTRSAPVWSHDRSYAQAETGPPPGKTFLADLAQPTIAGSVAPTTW